MHPAFSVILFTVLSGAGYGALIALALGGLIGVLPADRGFALVSFGLAISAVVFGLVLSSLHLGRPERAWRAFSQWRTSWLSREGLAAVFTFGPVLGLAYVWIFLGLAAPYFALLCGLTILLCLLTVWCTGMIYTSLKTIPQWNTRWTLAGYLTLGPAAGGVWVWAILSGFYDVPNPIVGWTAFGVLVLTLLVKQAYWRFIDDSDLSSSPAQATGLDRIGDVRVFETPHNQANYLMKEMGFQVARKHADRLRNFALGFGFFFPLALLVLSLMTTGAVSATAAVVAAVAVIIGQLFERWLFFAEAKHVVMSYYGG